MYSTCFGYLYIHHQELATVLLNYHIGRIVLGPLCVGDSVRLGLSSVRVAGFSLSNPAAPNLQRTTDQEQYDQYSNPAAPNLQRTTDQEQYDQYGNSTTQSQAPDDGYINNRNMLST